MTKSKKTKISWEAPEYEYHPKDKNWLLIAGISASILFLISIFLKNYLFSLLIGLSFFAISVYAFRKPEQIKITINSQGIKIKNILYDYENLSSFWIFYQPPVKELSLRSKKIIMPYVKIQLADQDPNEIREVLLNYLPEKKHKQSNLEDIARQLKF